MRAGANVGHRATVGSREFRGMAGLSASWDQWSLSGIGPHLRGSMTTPLLQARSITKRFGALQALADVDIDIHPGEVLAILGDNGAGKSTFIKILSGAYEPSAGTLLLDGAPVNFGSPQDAADVGIATIFQELALSENLSIAENVFLGRELVRHVLGVPFLKRRAMRQKVAELLRTLEAHISDPDAAVGTLSGGQRQAVAISRALNLNARLVIMDEPTAALAVAETRKVLQLIRRLAEGGRAVILISHNMHDVFEVADRIVVLRRGRKIAERRRSETDPEEVVSFITGAHPDVRALETQA
jgi:ABC-type sugar transport system ATPase subunit